MGTRIRKTIISRTLVLVLTLMFFTTVYAAERQYGWDGDLFVISDMGLTLVAPAVAAVASDDELAAENAVSGPDEPVSIASFVSENGNIMFAIGYKELPDEEKTGYPAVLRGLMASALGISTENILDGQSSLFEHEGVLLIVVGQPYMLENYVFEVPGGVYVFSLTAPADDFDEAAFFFYDVFEPMHE